MSIELAYFPASYDGFNSLSEMEYKPIPLPLHFSVKSKKQTQKEQPKKQPTQQPQPFVPKPAKPKLVARMCCHKVANQTIQPDIRYDRSCFRKTNKKHYFTPEDDEQLRQLYNEHGCNFKAINFVMTKFTERQLKERWNFYLDPRINKEPFSFEEDCLLLEKYQTCNSRWCVMVDYFPGRTVNQIKYRYAFLQRVARNAGQPLTPEFIQVKTVEWAEHQRIGQLKRQQEELKEGRSESEDEPQTQEEDQHVERALSAPIPPLDDTWIEPEPQERFPVIDDTPESFLPATPELSDIPTPDEIPNYDTNYGDYEDYHDYGTIDGTWNDL